MFEVTLDGERVALCNSLELAKSYQQTTPGSVIVDDCDCYGCTTMRHKCLYESQTTGEQYA